jgi:predicted dienelactone hydrolase
MGPTTMSVALNGTAQGKALPLVVMSHGTGGSFRPMCRQYPRDFAGQLIAKSSSNGAVPLTAPRPLRPTLASRLPWWRHPRYAEAVRLALPETPAICTSAVGFDRAAFHASFDAAVLGFFNKTLAAGSRI